MINRRRPVFVIVGVALLGSAITTVVSGISTRNKAMAALRVHTEDASVEDVSVIEPQPGAPFRILDLPGDVNAWYQAPIYARVSGYVKMWDKDYGAFVHRGDVLATISTPTLDAQYRAAEARLDVAKAKLSLADLTAKRWENLEDTQAVSRQQVDVQAADARAQRAEAEAAQQDLDRYQVLEGFRTVVAPFDGIVTSRTVNVGDYVSPDGGELANNGQTAELFNVADVHKLRIFVSVPQDYIDVLKKGVTAEITVPQYPGKVFHADFLTAAMALKSDSRTVTTELVMNNPDNQVWPGSYAEVHFRVPSTVSTLLVPENALLFEAQGEQVAVVDKTNHIQLKTVQVGRNLGEDVEILSGLSPDARVVNNPSPGLLTGEPVRIVPATNGYNEVASAAASEGQGR